MAADNTDDMIISISTDLATVRRSLKRLESDIASTSGNVVKQFDKMGKGIDNSMTTALQARIDKMVGIGEKGAKEWTGALADQGKELERLRARYSPLFSTLNTYKQTVADIRRAHAVGAISATEMTAAITRERQAALASTAAIKGRNQAIAEGRRASGQSFQTANIAAQFQDIGVTAAMGMSPLQIALQQGTQLSSVFATMGNGKQVVSGLAAALKSLISVQSLLTIGLVAGGAAAIQYFSALDWGGGKSEETLKREAELVSNVTARWGELLPALKAYNDERQKIADQKDIEDALTVGKSAQWDDLRKQISDVNDGFSALKTDIQQSSDDTGAIISLQDAFNKLKDGIDKGTASAEDAKRVQSLLVGFIDSTGLPTIADFAKQFDGLAAAIDKASEKASAFNRYGELTSRFPSQGAYDGVFRSPDFSMQGSGTILPDVGPTPTSRPLRELDAEPNKKAETAASRAKQAYDDLIKSANDRIGQLQLETELIGKFGVAADVARFRLDLLQQSEDKGRSLSPEQKAAIEEKVAAYEKYSQALAEAKLQQDLLDRRRMNALPAREQEVMRTLREYGQPDDLGSKNAGLIRDQLRTEEITSAADAFIDDFTGALLSGGDDIGKRLGQVILSALMDSAQEQLSSLLKQVFGALMNGGRGGATSPVAAAASTFAAPVGAVSRSALAPVASGGSIAAYIAQAAAKNGIDPNIALRVARSEGGLDSWNRQSDFVRNGIREQSYGPFQLYKGGGLGNVFQRQTGLDPALASSGPAGVDFAMSYAAKNGWGAWYGAGKAGIGNWEGIGQSSKSAAAALEKLAGASTETTKGLGSLASSLASSAGGAGLGGGGFNFASLFSPSFTPNTNIGNYLKGIPGFDGGGHTGNGARSGGLDGKGGFLALMHPRETVTDHTKRISAPRAPTLRARSAANGNGAGSNSLTVNINGASGDPHVRELVRQGVQEALAGQQEQMRRGGFGDMQDRYVSQRR